MEGTARIERLLALMLIHSMQDASVSDKALALSRADFSPSEIGSLLNVKANTISVSLSRSRSASPTTNKASKKKNVRKRAR